ncbi:MAG: FAD-dependent oxidoreductase [Chitinophagaceae bacterium]
MKCIIIGGGIIGLSSAYYLHKAGHEVIVIDKTDMVDGCSYGNAGYVCPSHFVPMPTPGIVQMGLKWMLNARSPFYVQPRLNWHLMNWSFKFIRSANMKQVNAAAIPLRDIALLSQHLYENDWAADSAFSFAYQHKGLLEIFQTEANAHHAQGSVEKARKLGLDVALLDSDELQLLEPHTKIKALGAIFFKCDGHLYPNKLMQDMKDYLQNKVHFIYNQEVVGFETKDSRVSKVITGSGYYEADKVVLATGCWSRELAAKLKISIPMMPGRGYSLTLQDSPYRVNYPAVIIEGRVAITPMDGNKIRFGGTMEITSTNSPMRMNRVEGILNAVKEVYPEFDIPLPAREQVWFGYRPCSADGLPYIGSLKNIRNCIIATGHSMLGLSLGAATGKLVSEVVDEKPTSINIEAFSPERFN